MESLWTLLSPSHRLHTSFSSLLQGHSLSHYASQARTAWSNVHPNSMALLNDHNQPEEPHRGTTEPPVAILTVIHRKHFLTFGWDSFQRRQCCFIWNIFHKTVVSLNTHSSATLVMSSRGQIDTTSSDLNGEGIINTTMSLSASLLATVFFSYLASQTSVLHIFSLFTSLIMCHFMQSELSEIVWQAERRWINEVVRTT
mgnify:CR=1 FL=1